MKRNKILLFILLLLLICTPIVSATEANSAGENCNITYNCEDGDWWCSATGFFGISRACADDTDISAITSIVELIKNVGNILFLIVAGVLGVKYIWGSVESKSSVKESLVTFIVAALFFYGWSAIDNIVNIENYIGASAESTAANIYRVIMYILNFLAIGGIIYIGIKYMVSGAEGKADLKVKMVPVILGLILVYGSVSFITIILNTFFLK